MFSGNGKINVNYGWELTLFQQVRDFTDGITFFEETLNWDRNQIKQIPKLEARLILFNFIIIEFKVLLIKTNSINFKDNNRK